MRPHKYDLINDDLLSQRLHTSGDNSFKNEPLFNFKKFSDE
jgi:hypothetical protein